MSDFLYTVGYALFGTMIKRALTGAGLIVGTIGVSLTILNTLVADMAEQLGSLPELAMALINLSGTDVALSMVMSAVITKHTFRLAKLHLLPAGVE